MDFSCSENEIPRGSKLPFNYAKMHESNNSFKLPAFYVIVHPVLTKLKWTN